MPGIVERPGFTQGLLPAAVLAKFILEGLFHPRQRERASGLQVPIDVEVYFRGDVIRIERERGFEVVLRAGQVAGALQLDGPAVEGLRIEHAQSHRGEIGLVTNLELVQQLSGDRNVRPLGR